MGRKYAIRDQEAVHFVTLTVVNWIDVFSRDEYNEIILDSLIYCRKNKGLRVHAYCIMTSHVHLILSVDDGCVLSDVIRDFKSYTARRLRETIINNPKESRKEWMIWLFERAGQKNQRNQSFQFWQQHNHPIELSNDEMLNQRFDYLYNNPMVAGFVDDPSAWKWSSCAAYIEGVKPEFELDYW
jgi:REP element-mobilizing transposase RayT